MSMPMTVGYTVFRKENLIPEIVRGIIDCFDEGDEIIFLFDDCNDNSKEVAIREFEKYNRKFIIIEPKEEQFEIKANNLILKAAANEIIVLFQDDMVCNDKNIKSKILKIMDIYKENLGLLGGRDGFNLRETTFPEKAFDKVSSWTHIQGNTVMLKEGEYAERTILNRGPIVFTKSLIEKVGYLDESFFPQWGDDMDYCFRCKYIHKLTNVVFQCGIKSPVEWGTTRGKTKIKKFGKVIKNNWNLLISRWGEYIK